MKTKRLELLIVFLIIMYKTSLGQTVVIDGYVYLEGQNFSDSILITIKRTVPGSLTYTTYTDTGGYFKKSIETGIYDITYSKKDFISFSITNQPIYSTKTFIPRTLNFIGLNGNLKGIIKTGIYRVGGNIDILKGDTLIIEPGTQLLFFNDIQFNISGLLTALGTKKDSIIFSRYNDTMRWNGIHFKENSDAHSIISFSLIEYSKNSGIEIYRSSPTIINSKISNNSSPIYGGGISMMSGVMSNPIGSPKIINTLIINNSAEFGGGICATSNFTISNSIIAFNSTASNYGGGICLGYNVKPLIINSVISNNSSRMGGGIASRFGAAPRIINSIISSNKNVGIYFDAAQNEARIYKSDFYGNTKGNLYNCNTWIGKNVTVNYNGDSIDAYGNIQLDPLFEDTVGIDYHLLSKSPCIDAGENDSVIESKDFESKSRILDGNSDGNKIVDMGALEYGTPTLIYFKGNNDNETDLVCKIVPNPSAGKIRVLTDGIDQIVVLNSLGEELYKGRESELDFSNQPTGLYLIKITINHLIITKKLIKK
jgi:predicted outer membrane repeat protein